MMGAHSFHIYFKWHESDRLEWERQRKRKEEQIKLQQLEKCSAYQLSMQSKSIWKSFVISFRSLVSLNLQVNDRDFREGKRIFESFPSHYCALWIDRVFLLLLHGLYVSTFSMFVPSVYFFLFHSFNFIIVIIILKVIYWGKFAANYSPLIKWIYVFNHSSIKKYFWEKIYEYSRNCKIERDREWMKALGAFSFHATPFSIVILWL